MPISPISLDFFLTEVTWVAGGETTDDKCSICWEPYTEPVRTPCDHIFCLDCLIDWQADPQHNSCPMCRRVFYPVDGVADDESEEEPEASDDDDDGNNDNSEHDVPIFQAFTEARRSEQIQRAQQHLGIPGLIANVARGQQVSINGIPTTSTREELLDAIAAVRRWSTNFELQNVSFRIRGHLTFEFATVRADFLAITMLSCFDTWAHPAIGGQMNPAQLRGWGIVADQLNAVLQGMDGERVAVRRFVDRVLDLLGTRLEADGLPEIEGGAPWGEEWTYRFICQHVLRFLHHRLVVDAFAGVQ